MAASAALTSPVGGCCLIRLVCAATAVSSRVVVTSRNQLAGLTALDAAHPLRLDVLSETDVTGGGTGPS